MKRNFRILALCLCAAIVAGTAALYALSVNQSLSNLSIKDANDRPASIPDFGSKVLTIFYNDAEASDLSDSMSDALKAKNYPESKTRGIGIANLKDSVAPNWLIRHIVKNKIAKYNSTILTDSDLTVARSWKLGDCNNKSICIVIGKDSKVKYMKIYG
jgi:predicted transcriptional regulator